MTIRATITLLTIPLFLILAGVNGALLYFQQRAEISRLFHDQAEAAAVTSAAFIVGMDQPFRILATPQRAAALAATARKLPGVNALYLVRAGVRPLALFPPSRPLNPGAYQRPSRPQVHSLSGHPGDRHVVALAPAGPDTFVITRIDAEPLMQQLAQTRRTALWIVLAAAMVASALAWWVARRITAELRVSGAAIDGTGQEDAPQALTICEARDLADAVRLMRAHSDAAAKRDQLVRTRNDRQRTRESALIAWHRAEFAPFTGMAAGRSVAIRMMGDTSPGCFFALCKGGVQAMIIIGRCAASTGEDALANALAARRFLEGNALVPDEDRIALARTAYDIEALTALAWHADQPVAASDQLACLTDDASARSASVFARRNPDTSPDELLDAITALLGASGVFAATGPMDPHPIS